MSYGDVLHGIGMALTEKPYAFKVYEETAGFSDSADGFLDKGHANKAVDALSADEFFRRLLFPKPSTIAAVKPTIRHVFEGERPCADGQAEIPKKPDGIINWRIEWDEPI